MGFNGVKGLRHIDTFNGVFVLQGPPQPGQPFKFSVGESCDRIKEEFNFLQAQYHRYPSFFSYLQTCPCWLQSIGDVWNLFNMDKDMANLLQVLLPTMLTICINYAAINVRLRCLTSPLLIFIQFFFLYINDMYFFILITKVIVNTFKKVDIDTTCPKAFTRSHWRFFFFFFRKVSHFLGENTYFLVDSWARCKLHWAVISLSNGVNIRVRGYHSAVSIKRSCKYHVGAHAKRINWCTDIGR